MLIPISIYVDIHKSEILPRAPTEPGLALLEHTVALMSMQGQEDLRFHQKYLNLC